ncbi:uncharacterized protein LOC106667113 [Cimex lectularius]|uniref:Uncharacterized protein n=1 Tax=Cimex lectularius TaxID=79782 RepID=A0A8I6RPU8_CIMLE|nr:uncharacterized protein LOC106667113 [Cimex lectularius]
MVISEAVNMRRCTTGQFKKPKENARNVFLHKIFKERCSFEYGSSPHPGRKSKSQSGWSYHSIKYKPKKNLPKSNHSVSVEEGESDFYEDALDEFYDPVKHDDPVPAQIRISTESLRIKVRQNDGITVDVSDPVTGFKKLQWTKDQLLDNYLEFVFEPNPQLEPKLTVLLGNVPIYAVNKAKGYGDCNLTNTKTDVAVQTSYALLDIDPMESDICTTQQNYNSALIETTGKQISFDELPYDKEISTYTIKGLNLDCNSVENTFNYLNPPPMKLSGQREASENTVSYSFIQNSHPNLLATRLRSKSFANLVNRVGDIGSPHTTSLVSSLPSDDVPFSCRQPIPFRKFSTKTAYPQSVDITVINESMTTSNDKQYEVTQNGDTMDTHSMMYVNDERLNNLSYASEHYLTELLQKTMRPINFTDEEELNRISETNAFCYIENSETSTSCEDVNTDQDGLETSPAIVDLTKFSEETGDDIAINKSEIKEESVYLSPKTPEINFEIKQFGQLTDVAKTKSRDARTPDEINTDLDKTSDVSELISLVIFEGEVESGNAPEENVGCSEEEKCNENESENYVDAITGNENKHESVIDVRPSETNLIIEESSAVLFPMLVPVTEEMNENKDILSRENSTQKIAEKDKNNLTSDRSCISSSNSTVSLEPIMQVLIEDSIHSRSQSSSKDSPRSPSVLSRSSNVEEDYNREVKLSAGDTVGEGDEADEADEADSPEPVVLISAPCQSIDLELEKRLDEINLTPMIVNDDIYREKSESKVLETDRQFTFLNKRSSKPKCSGSDSDIIQSETANSQIDKMRPQTTVNARNTDRPMTSVSQALKGVETALKPLQDQLKEIRTKMASLNHHFYNQYTEEKPKGSSSIFSIGKETDVLPMKYYAGRNSTRAGQVNGMKSIDGRYEIDKKTPNLSRATRYKAISIWSEPEDIIGDSPLPSVNLNFLGTKKTI